MGAPTVYKILYKQVSKHLLVITGGAEEGHGHSVMDSLQGQQRHKRLCLILSLLHWRSNKGWGVLGHMVTGHCPVESGERGMERRAWARNTPGSPRAPRTPPLYQGLLKL